uniref:Uncharacterized protein n=1 Tax=Timema cristinae TaxID=61476 RepID=A0A7R9H1N9_TIMCR|nr:unnamed protein product [Timema cristinae]
MLLIWLLLLGGLCCGCCGLQEKATPLLTAGENMFPVIHFKWARRNNVDQYFRQQATWASSSTVVVCLLSLGLWLLALVSLLVGGHGEVFVCRPLYDEPEFRTLTRLVDEPGVFYRRGGGFFSNMLYGNETMNVPLREVLMECQDNRPTYEAFRLHRVFDVDAASNHRSWDTLHTELANLEVNLTDLQLLTPYLQRQLTSLVTTSAVNLTSYRTQFSGQITGKDLSSFSNQLESVANQIKDLATASRMETLASRTRRLVVSHIQPLEQRKEDLVYQLTALEVQINPLQRQVNQSLSHLKTIQYFINNQGSNIAHQNPTSQDNLQLTHIPSEEESQGHQTEQMGHLRHRGRT